MKQFMDKDFLLETDTAKHLFHDYAAKMPIIDYHCHISPQEIAEDHHFRSITEVWLGGERLLPCRCAEVPRLSIVDKTRLGATH